MKSRSFKNRMRDNAIGDFILEYYRYILAAVLLIILIVVVAACTGKSKKKAVADNTTETQAVEESTEPIDFNVEFDHNANSEITALLTSYYEAYANGDVDTISTLATPVSENEKNFIKVISQYYESIDNVSYYSKNGEDDGTYFVSALCDIKFVNVDTVAPNMEFFYIETGTDGNLIINNIYSMYNLTYAENSLDSNIYSLIQLYRKQSDYESLRKDVEASYAEAVLSDDKLERMLNETLSTTIREWSMTIVASDETGSGEDGVEAGGENGDSESEEGTTGEEEGTTGESTSDGAEAVSDDTPTENVAATDGVNIRKSPSTDADVLGQVRAGAVLEKIGTEGDWTVVKYNGKKGYVKSEFIGKIPQVIAIDGVNIRKSPSTDAEVLGRASKGTILDKLGEKDEWTIVSYKNQKGYVKTEFVSNK